MICGHPSNEGLHVTIARSVGTLIHEGCISVRNGLLLFTPKITSGSKLAAHLLADQLRRVRGLHTEYEDDYPHADDDRDQT